MLLHIVPQSLWPDVRKIGLCCTTQVLRHCRAAKPAPAITQFIALNIPSIDVAQHYSLFRHIPCRILHSLWMIAFSPKPHLVSVTLIKTNFHLRNVQLLQYNRTCPTPLHRAPENDSSTCTTRPFYFEHYHSDRKTMPTTA